MSVQLPGSLSLLFVASMMAPYGDDVDVSSSPHLDAKSQNKLSDECLLGLKFIQKI
jgi:hypothetical protein